MARELPCSPGLMSNPAAMCRKAAAGLNMPNQVEHEYVLFIDSTTGARLPGGIRDISSAAGGGASPWYSVLGSAAICIVERKSTREGWSHQDPYSVK